MFEKKKMTEQRQREAITAARSIGRSFDEIKDQFPHLKRVAKRMEKEERQNLAPKHVISESITMIDRPTRAPR